MAYLVQSLVNLRAEIDEMWPNRSRQIDGWYRDPKVGISVGHNPDGKGAVHAIDVDKNGIWPPYIIDRIRRDNSVLYYVIWDRHIYDVQHGFRAEPYHGPNPHTDHVHFEVFQTPGAENYTGGWNIAQRGTQTFGQAPPAGDAWGDADPILGMAVTSGHVVAAGTTAINFGRGIASLRNL